MAAMLSMDARGQDEEVAGSISEEVGCCVSSTLPPSVAATYTQHMKLGSKRPPYLLVSSKTVNNIYFSGPI